jgi:hypothetical protein
MQCSKNASLFDNLVGAEEKRFRDRHAERLGSLENDDVTVVTRRHFPAHHIPQPGCRAGSRGLR